MLAVSLVRRCNAGRRHQLWEHGPKSHLKRVQSRCSHIGLYRFHLPDPSPAQPRVGAIIGPFFVPFFPADSRQTGEISVQNISRRPMLGQQDHLGCPPRHMTFSSEVVRQAKARRCRLLSKTSQIWKCAIDSHESCLPDDALVEKSPDLS